MKTILLISITLIMSMSFNLWGQGKPYEGPDDPAGDPAAERTAFMDGNRVLLFYRNTTELSDCCGLGYDVSKWPNNFDGTKMHDGIALILGGKVFLENDSVPVFDTTKIRSRNDLDSLVFLQSSYREFMDLSPDENVEWAFYPVFGYFNETASNMNETPAMSNDPNSWPLAGWPANGNGQKKWAGLWNGRFGAGIAKADLECYFVVNDAQDLEYLQEEDTIKYYPRPGVKIGDKKSDVTVQKGKPWGGMGLRVEQRGFQWSNPQATDAIFWEYSISNISDYDIPYMFFGYLVDNAVGGEEGDGDDIAYYTKEDNLNLCYSWDIDFKPVGGGKEPGLLGIAFLESPGIPFDGYDNDNDGLLDEKRDNQALNKIGPEDGIADLNKFLEFYHLQKEDLKEHWDADEDQDWRDWEDANDNGKYDGGELVNDDVGLDGIGPEDINYPGPDEGECNHKPDFVEGRGCEPNFAATDVSESDMLGLTTFRYLLDWKPGNIGDVMSRDDFFYEFMTSGIFDEYQDLPRNFLEMFASGTFPLYKGRTERVSMCELHSYDPLSGLLSDEHSAPSLFRLKEVVQSIYEADYQFAQPPLTPTLKAVPMDGGVLLSWDDVSDQKTRDPFMKNANDFEGYKLYRATDYKMSDAEKVTDGYGTPLELSKPIFQCDLKNQNFGFADYGLLNGSGFYLGNNTGIRHYYIDNDVQNGRVYYYVLCAYDYGDPAAGSGISPCQNNYVIRVDQEEHVSQVSKNVCIVTPCQRAAGYSSPGIRVGPDNDLIGTGSYSIEVMDDFATKNGHDYKIKFDYDSLGYINFGNKRHEHEFRYVNSGIRVYDMTAGDSLVYYEDSTKYPLENIVEADVEGAHCFKENKEVFTEVFEGLRIKMISPCQTPTLDTIRSGWLVGSCPYTIESTPETPFFAWDYDIVFTGNPEEYIGKTAPTYRLKNEKGVLIPQSKLKFDQAFDFYVVNKTLKDSTGEYPRLDMVLYDANEDGEFDVYEDEIVVGYTKKQEKSSGTKYNWCGSIFLISFANADNKKPETDDVFRVLFNRPFHPKDSILFKVNKNEGADKDDLNKTMDSIKVVPNPYVATNAFEPVVANWQLNQRRRIMFTHVPARCEIAIFTVSGVLVEKIKVENSVENRQSDWDLNSEAKGNVFWDLKSKEGLEVGPGYYFYHVKSTVTGKEKIGKFAILK